MYPLLRYIVSHYAQGIFARPVNLLIMAFDPNEPFMEDSYSSSTLYNNNQKSGTLMYFPTNGTGPSAIEEYSDQYLLAAHSQCTQLQYCGYQTHNSNGELNLSIEDVVADYTQRIITDINNHSLQQPLHFYGHSIGGIIAVEVARRVKEQCQESTIGSVVAYNTSRSIADMISSFIGRFEITKNVSFSPIYIPRSLLKYSTGYIDLNQSATALAENRVPVTTINLEREMSVFIVIPATAMLFPLASLRTKTPLIQHKSLLSVYAIVLVRCLVL